MQAFFQKIFAFLLSVLAFFGLIKYDPAQQQEPYTVKDGVVEFCFDSNPTTGYDWSAAGVGDSAVLTKEHYEQNAAAPGMAGVGGKQYYEFTAVHAGVTVVTFTYARSWEQTDADRTVTAVISVADDLTVSVTEYSEA